MRLHRYAAQFERFGADSDRVVVEGWTLAAAAETPAAVEARAPGKLALLSRGTALR